MAGSNAMFLFEVVIENVKSLVESRHLVIRSEFADIFSLELKDPKQMHIVIPEPPPLPPEPPGKKGKKPKPPKQKGKKGKVELPPPEPVIQSGQSVLFTSSPELLIQNMKKFPMEMSLWSKEDHLVFIGSSSIPWDQQFIRYLEKICIDCQQPPPFTLNEEYNVFEEGTAKLMAKIAIQIKLTYLSDKITTAFRTLSEDPTVKKVLYTGINSKTTSYICTLKTTDECFEENSNKIENNYIKDKPKPNKIAYADYKNAPGANLTFFNEGDYCCMESADKPPESIYKAPKSCPDIDFIVDYVRKIIVSCNDNMRMLTPRPTISPRIKATDIDRLCYCKETKWPPGEFAERFKKDVQSTNPCPLCVDAGKKPEGIRGTTFDVANIRGPCGKPDCRIARDLRAYIEKLAEEDQQEFKISEVIGPCGSKSCTLADKIQKFLRHEGEFSHVNTKEGLSTQCDCLKTMQDALKKKKSCATICSEDCEDAESDDSTCGGKICPFSQNNNIYNVYYFTVEHDFDKDSTEPSSPAPSNKSSKFQFCSDSCPSVKASEKTSCSKTTCASTLTSDKKESDTKCKDDICPSKNDYSPSPADSDVVIQLEDIHNPCCVKSCDVADKVKELIADGVSSTKKKTKDEDPCYCDCVCTFKFTKKTTYCAVCGGYECLGDDMKDQPEFMKPHPCPVYHKLYDKKYIKTPNPWPEEETKPMQLEAGSAKSSRRAPSSDRKIASIRSRSTKSFSERRSQDRKSDKKDASQAKIKKVKQEKKQVGKFTTTVEDEPPTPPVEKRLETKYPYPPVPKNMGWNWVAEDIPGMKPRPKWRPGAANKILVRRYRAIREGLDIIAKKKRAMMQRRKKVEIKPTLVIKKQGGEYTVQMEVFKKYSKERLLHQNPYEEKPPLVYTIGQSEEEKLKRQKAKERRERRETRRKSRLIQSTFRDRCQEICVKAYNQAIGLLPLPNPNDPACPCHTDAAPAISPPIDSCSCSDEGSLSSSDTDDDEWTIEFSPPAARWDVKAKHPPVFVENESQYNYLDYKVKLFDKHGNPVPRYFKGPDGKQECSDLGGFWGPDHIWTEINKDGYIGPDNRWVPMNFIGPDGMYYSAEEGSFVDATGQLLKIGIDGYIDKDGKWAWYSKRRVAKSTKSTMSGSAGDGRRSPKSFNKESSPPKATGDTKGKPASSPLPKGKSNLKSPQPADSGKKSPALKETRFKGKSPLVMSASVTYYRNRLLSQDRTEKLKWINMDPKKIAKYREIMNDLQMYEDLQEFRSPIKTNRACNTPNAKISPCSFYESETARY